MNDPIQTSLDTLFSELNKAGIKIYWKNNTVFFSGELSEKHKAEILRLSNELRIYVQHQHYHPNDS